MYYSEQPSVLPCHRGPRRVCVPRRTLSTIRQWKRVSLFLGPAGLNRVGRNAAFVLGDSSRCCDRFVYPLRLSHSHERQISDSNYASLPRLAATALLTIDNWSAAHVTDEL